MSFRKYVAISVLIHFFLIAALIIPLTSKNKVKPFIPKQWFLDAFLVLSEEKGIVIPDEKVINIIPNSTPSVIGKIGNSTRKEPTPRKSSNVVVLPENKTEKPESSAEQYTQSLRKAFMSRVNNQFLLIKTKAFFTSLRTRLNSLLNEAFPENTLPVFDGNMSRLTITFDENGKIAAVSISPKESSHTDYSNEFTTNLKEKVNWQSLPLPSDFALPYNGLNLLISISKNKFLIDIEPF